MGKEGRWVGTVAFSGIDLAKTHCILGFRVRSDKMINWVGEQIGSCQRYPLWLEIDISLTGSDLAMSTNVLGDTSDNLSEGLWC